MGLGLGLLDVRADYFCRLKIVDYRPAGRIMYICSKTRHLTGRRSSEKSIKSIEGRFKLRAV